MIKLVFVLSLAFLMSGCLTSIEVSPDTYTHMIALKSDGSPYELDKNEIGKNDSKNYDFESHIETITTNAVESGKEILIFVHGGMVPIKESSKFVGEALTKDVIIKRGKNYSGEYLLREKYPIFVNWESSMDDAYLEHLWSIRQGTVAGWWANATSPFYLFADLGRAITRLPIVYYSQLHNLDPRQDETPRPWNHLTEKYVDICEKEKTYNCVPFKKNRKVKAKIRNTIETSFWRSGPPRQFINIVPGILRLVTTPLLDSIGKSAWNNMLRRTQTIFRKPVDPPPDNKHSRNETKTYTKGGLTKLMDKLRKKIINARKDTTPNGNIAPPPSITLIGHSMGAIVLNEIIRRYPDLHYSNIVYLAAASTISDFEETVLPYMHKPEHSKTNFYNVTLHPYGDRHEEVIDNVPILPEGSLLDWIDDFASEPRTRMDHTMGKWNNIIRVLDDLNIPEDVKERIIIHGFPYKKGFPREHGEMNDLNVLNGSICRDTTGKSKLPQTQPNIQFWMKEFWGDCSPD